MNDILLGVALGGVTVLVYFVIQLKSQFGRLLAIIDVQGKAILQLQECMKDRL